MEKRRISKILAKTDRKIVENLANDIRKQYSPVIVKAPEKSLVMVKMREPVKESIFYLGEVIVSEAIVDIEGTKGMAVLMGDDFEKVMNMAIIDAACNKNIFKKFNVLEELENEQKMDQEKENALFMKTVVNFNTMNTEE